jgi:hypothetical protein
MNEAKSFTSFLCYFIKLNYKTEVQNSISRIQVEALVLQNFIPIVSARHHEVFSFNLSPSN